MYLYINLKKAFQLSHLRHKEIDLRVPLWGLCNQVPGSWADSRTFCPCKCRSCSRPHLVARIRRRDCSNGCQAKCPERVRRRP